MAGVRELAPYEWRELAIRAFTAGEQEMRDGRMAEARARFAESLAAAEISIALVKGAARA